MPNRSRDNQPLSGPLSASDRSSGTRVRSIPSQLAVEVPGPLSVSDPAVPADDSSPIVVEALAVPWNMPVEANVFGDTIEFAPGSLTWAAPSRVKFLLDHTNHAFGYGVDFVENDFGLVATMAVPRDELSDPATARAVQQMRNGVRDAVSVGVELTSVDSVEDPDQSDRFHHTVTAGRLLELSSCVLPRYDDARISTIAATRTPIGATAMTATIDRRFAAGGDSDDEAAEDEPVEDEQTEDEPAEADRVKAHRRTVAASRPTAARPVRDRYGSIGDFAHAVLRGEVADRDRRRIGFALNDLTTSDVPGLLPPQWVKGFADTLNVSRPVISAFSQTALTSSGMSVEWPRRTRTGPLTGVQVTEKTEIVSGAVGATMVSSPVVTWAGGQDLSLQVIERSDPSALSLWLEEATYDLAFNGDTQVATAIAAGATGGTVTIPDAAGINAALAHAAALVFNANYGAYPDVLVLGLNAWEAFAGASDPDGRPLFPNMNGSNPLGQLSFTDLSGSVRGLQVICSPAIDPAYGILGWSGAVTTMLGPVNTVQADVPAILGRDYAIYQFATWMIRRPDALVKLIPPAPPPPGDDTSSSRSSKK